METVNPTISSTRRDITNPWPPPTEVGIVSYRSPCLRNDETRGSATQLWFQAFFFFFRWSPHSFRIFVIPSITKRNHKRTKNKEGRFLPSQIVQKFYQNNNGDDLNRLFFWFIITDDYLELNPVAVKDCHHQVTTNRSGCLVFLVRHRHHDVIRLVY